MEFLWRENIDMRDLKKSLKNKAFVLPITLFFISIFIWLFSIVFMIFKNEINDFYQLKKANDSYWRSENMLIIGEYELYKGNKQILNNKYNDIIEYFEDKNRIWIDKNQVSNSGYTRKLLKQNGKIVDGKVKLYSYVKSTLNIELSKQIAIDDKIVEIIVTLLYEYEKGVVDFYKSQKRAIEGIRIKIKYEKIGD